MAEKCRFCRWYKVAGAWVSECNNSSSEFYGWGCVEKQGDDSEQCDDKEEEE